MITQTNYSRGIWKEVAEEKNFENKVKKYLDSIGAYHFKIWGGGFQKSGLPDIICCNNGIFVGIEVKAKNGHASELQKYNCRKINEAGGIGIILFPDGFNDFKKIMEGMMKCNSHIQGLELLKNANSNSNCIILKD